MTTTYKVEGMTCGGCARAVTNAIKAHDPASTVDVDLEKGTVTVAGPLSDAMVRKAVEEAGFDYKGAA